MLLSRSTAIALSMNGLGASLVAMKLDQYPPTPEWQQDLLIFQPSFAHVSLILELICH